MGKYGVDYSCGHHGTVELFGKVSEREKRVEWMERGVCPECFRKQKEEEKRIANEQAAKDNAEIGLPALVGSEKQIAWAESIRKNALNSPWNIIIKNYVTENADKQAAYQKALELRNYLEKETSAKWWIDHRNIVDCYIKTALQNTVIG